MLLLGVADCCSFIRPFAFTGFSTLPNSVRAGFSLRLVASSKRQTNGKLQVRVRVW
jgi:hypothetical protein